MIILTNSCSHIPSIDRCLDLYRIAKTYQSVTYTVQVVTTRVKRVSRLESVIPVPGVASFTQVRTLS